MLDLLRPEQKKKIIREYHTRFFVLACAMLFSAEVIAIVLLVPSYVTSKARADVLKSQAAVLQVQSVSEKVSNLNDLVKKINGYVNIFSAAPTSTDVSAAINNVVDNRGPAVKINAFVYSAQNIEQQIIVQGVAATRQDLLDFVKRLKQQQGVSSVNLPISDFSESQNISFSLTIIGTPQKP